MFFGMWTCHVFLKHRRGDLHLGLSDFLTEAQTHHRKQTTEQRETMNSREEKARP
jgi:hypothetical protein